MYHRVATMNYFRKKYVLTYYILLVQLTATHIVSCPLEPILTSTPSVLVPLLTGTPSRQLWSLVLPFIRCAVRYIPAWPTPSNHTTIPRQ